MTTQVRYAAYVEAHPSHKGDSTFSGKSDGLERRYFGNDIKEAEKIIKGARDQRKDYRLDEMTYDSNFGLNLSCKVRTLKVWPATKAQRYQAG